MTTAVPTQRHPAADWPLERQHEWSQKNFCPCGTEIPWAAPHCDTTACRTAHTTAEHLLDLMGDLDDH